MPAGGLTSLAGEREMPNCRPGCWKSQAVDKNLAREKLAQLRRYVAEMGVLPESLADRLEPLGETRNIIVHDYPILAPKPRLNMSTNCSRRDWTITSVSRCVFRPILTANLTKLKWSSDSHARTDRSTSRSPIQNPAPHGASLTSPEKRSVSRNSNSRPPRRTSGTTVRPPNG